MSDIVTVAKPQEADLPSICDLLVELMEHVDGETPDRLAVQRIDDRCGAMLADPVSHVLIARHGEAVVGFINFVTRKTLYHDAPSALIDELIVAQPYHGQGIGKRLIFATLDMCRQLGCSEVEVSTLKSNHEARAFYKRCGFEEDAVLLEMHLE
jgi:GNAT superfamily N-acetyltransferase